jgi:DNA mismatch endonuclease (patch repair protein)
MDVHSPEQRSFNMSRIRGQDTRPEMMVRGWLWANGYRYRLHRKDLPGKPDVVLPKFRAVIFVHGCFWHRHGCRFSTTPGSRQDFWLAKFSRNVSRDRMSIAALMKLSWRVMVVWECSLHGKEAVPDAVARQIMGFLNSDKCYEETDPRGKPGNGICAQTLEG